MTIVSAANRLSEPGRAVRTRSTQGRSPESATQRMIQVAAGVGEGPTKLAAFDAALCDAGVANFNLIYLSSVIPPHSDIQVSVDGSVRVEGEWGDRLYVVMAEQRTDVMGEEAWAGVGWVQQEHDGRGLFVEHHGFSELKVRGDIEASLGALCDARAGEFGPVGMAVSGVTCEALPACALVVAVFGAEPWGDPKQSEFMVS